MKRPTRREFFLQASGFLLGISLPGVVLTILQGCATLNSPSILYTYYQLRNSGSEYPGTTFQVSSHQPITPLAEGWVRRIVPCSDWSGQDKQCITIDHPNGRTSFYWSFNEIFVNAGDWVGRNSIIGIGGGDWKGGRTNLLNVVMIQYFMNRRVFNALGASEDGVPNPKNNNEILIDPEAHGAKGRGLAPWSGDDLYTAYLNNGRDLALRLEKFAANTPERVRANYGKFSGDWSEMRFWMSVLESKPDWLTAEDAKVLNGVLKDLLSAELPLTAPFPSEDLKERFPTLYTKGSIAGSDRARFEDEYARLLLPVKRAR